MLLATVALSPACETTQDPARGGPPPVLLITVEGLVTGDLAAFGGDIELPNLEAFAAQSTVSRALTVSPMTRPAVASILTGLAPDRHTVRDDLFSRLPEDIPTLAGLLAARGYETAAFPDSSYLSNESGLWRGFDLVDDPPPAPRDASRWLPRFHEEEHVAVAADWLGSLDGGKPWFGWVHLSHPLLGQFREMFGDAAEPPPAAAGDGHGHGQDAAVTAPDAAVPETKSYEESLQAFDRQLGRLLEAVDARDDGALVVLATTLGDIRVDVDRQIPMAMGFSLEASRVDVPILIRRPGESAGSLESPGLRWSPDVAATIAGWTGVELDPRAEGRDLLEASPPPRTIFSWSWATLDQFGWRPLVLAADAEHRLVLSGDRVVETDAPDGDEESLRQAILGRATPPVRQLPQDVADALLAQRGLQAEPGDPQGREFEDPDKRFKVTSRIWRARANFLKGNVQLSQQLLAAINRRLDPSNPAPKLDRGHALALLRNPASIRSLEAALKLKPRDGDIWHWYAHALLRSEREEAEKILVAVQPHLLDQADVLYDLACTRSLAGDAEASGDYLARAWRAGFQERQHIEADPDLRHLRETGKLSEVMRQFQ